MEIKECFLVLGIEPIKDERQIKNAYREKLAVTNPEDDPEGFKRLRNAYELACQYAKSPDEEPKEEPMDDTPSGIWMQSVVGIYGNMKSRCSLKDWEVVLEDDILESLEEEENCRLKFLRFLMGHYRLPSAVWKLIDQKMRLTQDASSLREQFPVDFVNYILNRVERGEDIVFELFEGAEDAEYDLFLNYYDNCWNALQEENAQEAARLLVEADGLEIYHPAMEICRGHLLELQKKTEELLDFMRCLYQKHPEDDMVCYHTAEALWKHEHKAESAEIYQKIKERNDKHYMANFRLTEWYYEVGNYPVAKKCAEGVLAAGTEDSFLEILAKVNAKLVDDLQRKWEQQGDVASALELGWCYLQDGDISKGLCLVRKIEKCLPEDKKAEYYGLCAKLSIEQGEFHRAIEMCEIWRQKLLDKMEKDEAGEEKERDEDRILQSYFIQIQCYRNLGYLNREYFKKSLPLFDKVMRGGPKDIGILLEKAQVLMEMEEYDQSLEITRELIEDYQVYAACATAMEVYKRQWQAGGVIQNAQLIIQNFPNYTRAYDVVGRVYLDLDAKDALKDLLNKAKENHVSSPYLDAYAYHLEQEKIPEWERIQTRLEVHKKQYVEKIDAGDMSLIEKGEQLITEYFYMYPGPYMLQERAMFYKVAQLYQNALEDFERILVDDPGNAYIHAQMAYISCYMGKFETGLTHMKKAIIYSNEDPWGYVLYVHIAKIYMRLGDEEAAIRCLRHYEKLVPKDTSYYELLAECYARLQSIPDMVDLCKKYYTQKDGKFSQGYYAKMYDLYLVAQEGAERKNFLKSWKSKEVINTGRFGALPIPKRFALNKDRNHIDYFYCAAWEALLDGKEDNALYFFEQYHELLAEENEDPTEGLQDLVFAMICFSREREGSHYAKLMRDSMKPERFYDTPKILATREFLANYYLLDEADLQAIIDRGNASPICRFCVKTGCKELNAMQVLLYLKYGKIEEARRCLAAAQKIQGYEDYIQALVNRKYPEE